MSLPEEIIRKLEQFIYRKDEQAREKQREIGQQLQGAETHPEGITLVELHVLDLIGAQPELNVIGISRQMGMTRGAISKICSRLERKGFAARTRNPLNQKEVYFQLTPTGQRLWDLHQRGHQESIRQYNDWLGSYKPEELAVIGRFLDELMQRKL